MTLHVSVAQTDLEPIFEAGRSERTIERIWAKDGTVWTDPIEPEIENRLGWLDLPVNSMELIPRISQLAADAVSAGITDVVLCGMGGSSLAPEVFAASFQHDPTRPLLTVIDTTHPDAVQRLSAAIDPRTTWFIISSKSGGTLETLSLFHHFWGQTASLTSSPGQHFIAITDPGSSLSGLAGDHGFRAIVHADPDVGGRYAALTAFGLVPAGLIGIDLEELLLRAQEAAGSCRNEDPAHNPGFALGVALGARAVGGSRTAYFEASAPGQSIPVWAEQLLAESTGKEGTGILPVAGGPRPANEPATVVAIGASPDPSADVRMTLDDPYDIGAAMFVLEFATAVAGWVLGIHPFDQPDVQLAKQLAHEAMEGTLKAHASPITDLARAAEAVTEAISSEPAYISVHAYVEPTEAVDAALADLASALSSGSDRFVTIGYGPRFLHSTGQLHKGGFSGGVFVQLVDEPTATVAVPTTEFTFNELISGQAAGDLAALDERNRTVVSVSTGDDPEAAIRGIATALTSAT